VTQDLRSRVERTEALMRRFIALKISAARWAQHTRDIDQEVSYRTIRRVIEGDIPTLTTIDRLEKALDAEEENRLATAA